MSLGPGRYDHLATYVREASDADSVVVLVLPRNGKPGLSVQTRHPDFTSALPSLLRAVADEIEKDTGSSS